MTAFHFFIILQILDALTTIKALDKGAFESNKVVKYFLEKFSRLGVDIVIVILKAGAVFLAYNYLIGTEWLPLLNVFYSGVVLWNLLQLKRLS